MNNPLGGFWGVVIDQLRESLGGGPLGGFWGDNSSSLYTLQTKKITIQTQSYGWPAHAGGSLSFFLLWFPFFLFEIPITLQTAF